MAASTLSSRILPAILTASGVALLAGGLLSYTNPVAAGPAPSPSATVAPTPTPSPTPRITLPPLASAPVETVPPSLDPNRVASRVRIAALDIDMPIVQGPPGYPYCDVAMYLKELGQPGEGWATYLFAHAREGMFLPLLETPERQQRGMVVEVWTNDGWRYLYEITDVRRDQRTLDDALAADHEQLWLQTSEGPRGTPGKTQVIAEYLSAERADLAEANPEPHIDRCG